MSELLSVQGLQRLFVKNRRARYALLGTLAALIASLAEMKRRADKRDEVKRKIPHRRNSAVHLYDGSFSIVFIALTRRFIRDFCAIQEYRGEGRHKSDSSGYL